MNTIIVNGKRIQCSGSNVSIINGRVIVDGKEIANEESREVYVTIEGDVNKIDCSGSVTVKGNVKGNIDCSGSCEVEGDVGGDIDASGSVRCDNVSGSVDASGSVRCGKILSRM